MPKTTDFAEVIKRKMDADPLLARQIERITLLGEIAQQVLDAREAADMSQHALAVKSGVSMESIDDLEESEADEAQLWELLHIAKALGMKWRLVRV